MKRPLQACIECHKPSVTTRCTSCAQKHTRHIYENRKDDADQVAYRSREYQRARAAALKRWPQCHLDTAPRQCDGPLTVHHIDHDPTNNTLDNLATICRLHHAHLEAEYRDGARGIHHATLDEALKVRT